MAADRSVISSLAGTQTINVVVDVGAGNSRPGRYTLLVTATDGLISQSAYFELTVLQRLVRAVQ